jgi:6-phosphogluconate dehydrogenase
MNEKDFLFTDEALKFIDENEDRKLNDDIMDAVSRVATGKNGKGNTRKTMIAIAAAAAVFLKMCANMSDEKLTALDYSEPFSEILRFYCMKLDHPVDEE